MRKFIFACAVLVMSSLAFAQAPLSSSPLSDRARAIGSDPSLATPTGYDVTVGLGGYEYSEPGAHAISIHGAKFQAGVTGTRALTGSRDWLTEIDLRGMVGSVTYDGWCSPWLITPAAASANGYALGLGGASACSESGDKDWYMEGRVLLRKAFVRPTWAVSPYLGLGLRHLSNGTTGIPGYRTDDYFYVPFGGTVRARTAAGRPLSVTFEYDRLLHGWQHTYDSALGSGEIDATVTAPAFTIDGLTDISFAQHTGWALRASLKVQMTKTLSVEPYYVRWNVDDSRVNDETATFTVNGVTAQQHLGAYEPFNVTNEFGVNVGFHF